jgi:tetratricopeptide (TPR) repeat protein/CHAT domain-containing protein
VNQGAYIKAEKHYLRALEIRERSLGPDHLLTAVSNNNLAALYDNLGSYSKAEMNYTRALAIIEKTLGPDHPLTATSINNLGLLYANQGSYDKAEKHYLRALEIRTNLFGADHIDTATSLNNLATLYITEGDYLKAEPLLTKAFEIRMEALGPDHPSTATSLSNLALLYDNQGAFEKAKTLYLQALEMTRKALGPDHPSTAISLNNLAELYRQLGLYGKAEQSFQKALDININALGPNHLSTALTLNNLAVLYEAQGAYGKATNLYERALAIREKTLGPDHPDTATSLNNLASLYFSQGAYDKAEPLYQQALAINESALGSEHPSTATILNNLAELNRQQGDYTKAEPQLRRALIITEKALGPDHPDTATSINNLAELRRQQGDYDNAEPLSRQALSINQKVFGPDHPRTAQSLNNLAVLYFVQGAYAKGEPLLLRGITTQSRFLQAELPLLPLAARDAQVQAIGPSWERAFTGADRSPNAASLALFSRLNRYGLLLEIERRQGILLRAPGPQREQARQLASLIRQLAGTDLPQERRQALQQRRLELERDLYRTLPALQPRILQPADLAAALPQGAVYLAFQRYQPFDGTQSPESQWGKPRYLALVLHRDGTTQAVELGPAAPIDALIRSAIAITRSSSSTPDEVQDAWGAVNQKLFPPSLVAKLQGANRWIISPDGELSRIPFLALPSPLSATDSDRQLAESIDLQLVSSGRELVNDPAREGPQPPAAALVLADPDFGPSPPGPWERLSASAKEGTQIASQLGVTPKLQSQASKSVVLNSLRPQLLHIASHGFFAASSSTPAQSSSASAGRALRSNLIGPPDHREDAMLNSAIVLAGANRNRDTGTLTAREAAQLQLDGTELVVLSACETALGEQRSGEGVYGLQRALSVAGARSTLLSLWKVPDDGTAAFMESYYELLKQGKGRLEALRQVQAEFRNPETSPCRQCSEARYWAAWQLTGVTGPVEIH